MFSVCSLVVLDESCVVGGVSVDVLMRRDVKVGSQRHCAALIVSAAAILGFREVRRRCV